MGQIVIATLPLYVMLVNCAQRVVNCDNRVGSRDGSISMMVAYPYLYVDLGMSSINNITEVTSILICGIHLLLSTICFVGNFHSMLSHQSYVCVKGNGIINI
jgi:hypothetical protein